MSPGSFFIIRKIIRIWLWLDFWFLWFSNCIFNWIFLGKAMANSL